MERLAQIIYESLISTGRFPRRWILAFLQVAAFSLVAEFGRPHWLQPPFIFFIFFGGLILSPITVWLWLDVEATLKKQSQKISHSLFYKQSCTVIGFIFCSVLTVAIARFLYLSWVFLAVISSVISATALLAMLFAVLSRQSFSKSLALSFDTWDKKISLVATYTFILMIAHGVSFALVHGVFKNLGDFKEFSVFAHSATIWIMLVALIFFISFTAAFLNSVIVALFLETINRKKAPEALKNESTELAQATI